MHLAGRNEPPGVPTGPAAATLRVGAGALLILLAALAMAVTSPAWGQTGYEEEGYNQISREGLQQIDRINHALELAGKIFVGVGIALLAIVALKILSPARIYDNARERRLRKAVRGVDDLLQRIQKEAETTSEEAKEDVPQEGILAGMTEIAEFGEVEHVPSYVLTVNDFMLDNIRTTLKKLRRFDAGDAARYRDYLFSVIKGVKAITEQSVEAGVSSGLAVDIRDYFADDKRYKVWNRLLGRFAKRGKYQEIAHSFLLFMRDVREGRPLTSGGPKTASADTVAVAPAEQLPAIPDSLSEETLPALQDAAQSEAKSLRSLVVTSDPPDRAHAWQFELVRRQQQIHLRDEAQRMLSVFLSCERKALQEMTKMKMLPCQAWSHVLHMLGTESTAQLSRRIDDRLLTIQEIIILEKAFLQTLAKRNSLARIYGHGQDAGLMRDVHVPEIRRQTLALLRQSQQTEPKRFARATEELNEEETPQHNEVSRLIEHYVTGRHTPPDPQVGPQTGSRS